MTEQEKQVIEELKEEINKPLEVPEDKFDIFILYNIESARTTLNLIENQSKEIEELKDKTNKCEYYEMVADELYKNSIRKDKIKAKLEELEKEQEDNRKSLYNAINNLNFKEIDKISNRICVNMTVRGILQSLLEEE